MPTASDIRARIERVIDAFEEAWLAGHRPRIEDHLDAELRDELLVELVFTDLEYRLRAGETSPVEDYGRRFPELKKNPEQWHALIVEEFRLRGRLGQNPEWNDYVRRFPAEEHQLQTILQQRTEAHTAGPALPPGSLNLPAMVKRYRVQRIIAEGGMGFVARVVDTEFDRPLAMKVMASKFLGDTELEDRFLREARLTGQLQHPGIPPVQEKGRLDDGTPFFIMKLIKGRSLQRLLRDRGSPKDSLGIFLEIFAGICKTMAYAHARGIIHRDLKPANIMVGAFGEVQVMDWGLAKVLRSGIAAADSTADTARAGPDQTRFEGVGNRTRAGVVMGTPGYMAPEQARGEIGSLDQRCDVFGLGAILCDILTSKPPFVGTKREDAIRQAAGDLHDAYQRLDQSGADLELIALAKQCLSPRAEDRPADGGVVATAIAAYQANAQDRLKQAELENARLLTRTQESAKRRRDRRILGGCILAILLAAVVIWRVTGSRAVRAAETASHQALALIEKQTAKAKTKLEFHAKTLDDAALAETRHHFAEAQADLAEAREKRDLSTLTPDDLVAANRAIDACDTEFKIADKRLKLGEKLAEGLARRGVITEADLDVRLQSPVPIGRGGPAVYRPAFRAFGVDVEAAKPQDVAAAIGDLPFHETVALALTDWCLLERKSTRAKHLFAVAEAVDARSSSRGLARSAALAGNVEELIRLGKDPVVAGSSSDLVVLLAGVLQEFRQYAAAIDLLERAATASPGDGRLRNALGLYQISLAQGRAGDAVDHLKLALTLRPNDPFVAGNLAKAHIASGQPAAAQKVCVQFLGSVDSKNPFVRAQLAEALSLLGKTGEAGQVLDEGLKASPHSGFLDAGRAALANRKATFAIAHGLAEKTREQHSGFRPALVALGIADAGLNNHASAADTGDYLLRRNDQDADAHLILGRAHLGLGNINKAQLHAGRAASLAPKDAAAHELVGRVQFAVGDYDAAFRGFKASAELSQAALPGFSEVADRFNQKKLPSQANWLYGEVLRRDPSNTQAWDGFIDTLHKIRDADDAVRRLGPTLEKLSPEQRKRLDEVTSTRAVSPPTVSRPINGQEDPLPQASPKRAKGA